MFLGPFTHLLKHPAHCTLIHTLPFLLFAAQSQKPHLHGSILMLEIVQQGLAFISNTLGFSAPIHFMLIHGLWLAYLPCPSVWMDSNVPACGWLDPWHRIEFPNNARGLHGQAAQHSQRHLSCEEGLLSESQGDI